MAFVRLQGLLSAQRRIRVSLVHDDRILYGPRLTYTTLMADSSPGQWAPSVNLSAVRVIAVPRSRAGRFALEGSVAGGTLGLVGGLLSQAQIFCDHSGGSSGSFSLFGPCRPFDGGKVAWTTVETAAIGAILGAAIGAIGREWRAVYAAPGNERRIP